MHVRFKLRREVFYATVPTIAYVLLYCSIPLHIARQRMPLIQPDTGNTFSYTVL
jgi:hypothetical protein